MISSVQAFWPQTEDSAVALDTLDRVAASHGSQRPEKVLCGHSSLVFELLAVGQVDGPISAPTPLLVDVLESAAHAAWH